MEKEKETLQNQDTEVQEETPKEQETEESQDEERQESTEDDEVDLEAELAESKDKYLRLYSEFENFRRRTSKEKLEIINTASKDVVIDLLSILDDFDRAFKSFDEKAEVKTVKEGMDLIFNKLSKTLEGKGLKKMEINPGDEFDEEFHDAITQIPAPDKKLVGKIVDVVEQGYYLNDKVIRFAKVVTGAKP
ncbi:MAG: nucleotide exchange factor GrpE [Cyclobacteriaceae bacterium]|nr:nucleotide exchange factor GrpE [Cyclobacteriaceae bacterium HetDA_MAG_MS6]